VVESVGMSASITWDLVLYLGDNGLPEVEIVIKDISLKGYIAVEDQRENIPRHQRTKVSRIEMPSLKERQFTFPFFFDTDLGEHKSGNTSVRVNFVPRAILLNFKKKRATVVF
jgi:hypothetical protein